MVADDFPENISYLENNIRMIANRNIQIMIDILELSEISDEHVFVVYDLVNINDYPILLIRHEAVTLEELILDKEDAMENIKRMSDMAYARPDLEYLQKYKRMQIEIDMGI